MRWWQSCVRAIWVPTVKNLCHWISNSLIHAEILPTVRSARVKCRQKTLTMDRWSAESVCESIHRSFGSRHSEESFAKSRFQVQKLMSILECFYAKTVNQSSTSSNVDWTNTREFLKNLLFIFLRPTLTTFLVTIFTSTRIKPTV